MHTWWHTNTISKERSCLPWEEVFSLSNVGTYSVVWINPRLKKTESDKLKVRHTKERNIQSQALNWGLVSCFARLALPRSVSVFTGPMCPQTLMKEHRYNKRQTSLRTISPKLSNSHQNNHDWKTPQVRGNSFRAFGVNCPFKVSVIPANYEYKMQTHTRWTRALSPESC